MKKTILSLLLLFMVTAMSAQRVLNTERYDVNRDGNVTISDVTLLVNAVLGKVNYPIKEIILPNELFVVLGDGDKTLKPDIRPADADYLTLLWTSSNEDVAKVDQTGKVTGIARGTCATNKNN